jgi:hypothetical protein
MKFPGARDALIDLRSLVAECLLVALNGHANLAQTCPLSAADRKSFEPSEHFR